MRNASRGNDMNKDIGDAKVKPCQENKEVLKRSKWPVAAKHCKFVRKSEAHLSKDVEDYKKISVNSSLILAPVHLKFAAHHLALDRKWYISVVFPIMLLLLLLLSRFSRVWLGATPWTAAHQASRPWDCPGKNTGGGCHFLLQCIQVKSEREVAQSCPTLSDPMDCSLPGSSVHGIFQARVLEWGDIAFSTQ